MRRLSSAAMQPSIACASPGARVQEQSTCALLLLHVQEARFACHQVRRRTCEQLRACGHTPEQLPERNLCTYTGSAVRCLVSTAMMPSLARTTSAVCSLPGAHAHTRSVVCLCWRRGVMLTCTRAGVCWASSTRGMRAARTSQRRSQAGLARRRVRGGVHARRSRLRGCVLLDNAAEHGSHVARSAPGSQHARCPHGDMRAHAGAAVDLRVVRVLGSR